GDASFTASFPTQIPDGSFVSATATDPGSNTSEFSLARSTVPNQPPVADAGTPQTVHTGTVTLHGSGSYDPDGDALTYLWEQTGGTPVTLSDPTAESPTFDSPLV
ncbi:MAG: hypothetical protein GWN58_07480, partial [Anaerolineae bacterium]|nr:hypothetical protein [Anaerolineae bacterium]